MLLKQLKLAGFKSFVEPTTIPFPSQLVAVVGPNGCGKSNIIDAVRWVLGESSARTLRGDAMVDVIFNGSSQRKSLGQASVELLFDNSLGRLGGPYASYQEIAIKRVVTREGDSLYYLNGARCRKRDITDLFLGTGAGARGYAIIGQDTVSHLIEAKPEEMRGYVEEAAGVSKYKERRRETIQRINHTEANLARINDIRLELDKQLERLERQAKAAARFQTLQQNELDCKADILALKWQLLSQEQTQIMQQRQTLSLLYEQHQAKYTEGLVTQNQLQINLQNSEDEFQRTQLNYYELNTAIARLEATIAQQQQEKNQLTANYGEWSNDLEKTTERIQEAETTILPCEEQYSVLQAKIQTLVETLENTQQQVDVCVHKKEAWEQQWHQLQVKITEAQRMLQKEEVTKNHLQQRYQQISSRQETLAQTCANHDMSSLQENIKQLQNEQTSLNQIQDNFRQQHRTKLEEITRLRQQYTKTLQTLNLAQDKVQTLTIKKAALQGMQQSQLGKTPEHILASWQQPRLAELLSIQEGWHEACEWVLGENLQAIVVESLDNVWPKLTALKGHALHFTTAVLSKQSKTNYPRLMDKIQGPLPHLTLEHVFAAEKLEEALSWLPHLEPHASVVTKEGYWLGNGWIKVQAKLQDEESILLRQRALAELKKDLSNAEEEVRQLCQGRDMQHTAMTLLEEEADALQKSVVEGQQQLQTIEREIGNQARVFEQQVLKLQQWQEEKAQLQVALNDLLVQKTTIEASSSQQHEILTQYETHSKQLLLEKREWQDALSRAEEQRDETREMSHQVQLQYQSEQLKLQQLKETLTREKRHAAIVTEKLAGITVRMTELNKPDSHLHITLHEKITQHQTLEKKLNTLREQIQSTQQTFQKQDRYTKDEQHQANQVLEKIQQTQIQEQMLQVRANALLETLSELNKTIEIVLAGLPDQVTLASREQTLLELNEKIKRLGAINLIAIEEYQNELQRKQQLDYQYQDLTEALATLNAAMVKMDQETSVRLKETFDAVNASFQTLFPRLFGGGRALLTWTCDNLLNAGIVVMAQPPGKRNSTIHSLSGGEKAMTAIALIFAIFRLNPSPFCMLDEVDAPLDEVNIGRFCDLVKEMSAVVQFLFITHNKVTMEMADHLIGITMREPGASRMVAVDVEEALAMAE